MLGEVLPSLPDKEEPVARGHHNSQRAVVGVGPCKVGAPLRRAVGRILRQSLHGPCQDQLDRLLVGGISSRLRRKLWLDLAVELVNVR